MYTLMKMQKLNAYKLWKLLCMLQTVFYLVKFNECSLKLLLAWLSMCLICLGLDKSITHVLSFDIIYEDTVSLGRAYLSSFFKDNT